MQVTYLKMAIDVTQEAPAELGEVWSQSLENKTAVIDHRMQTRVPDEETYLNKIADRAEENYRPFPNPTFISKKGLRSQVITAKQASNIKRAYQKFKDNWNYMFGNGGQRFKDKVLNSVGAFLKGIAARTLPMTGFKQEGRGPAAITGFWLSGEEKIIRELRSGDTSLGGPFRICPSGAEGDFRAALAQRLIKSGAIVLRSSLDDTAIGLVNNKINQLVERFVDPTLGLVAFAPGADSHVDFIKQNKQLFLEIQVSTV